MKKYHRIILLASLTILAAGCASNSARVTGTEGSVNAAQSPETASRDVDSDGDSVADANDRCEDTDFSALVDSTGCEVDTGVIFGLNFGPNETTLPPGAGPILDRYIDALNRNPDVVVAVEAHTDNRGPAADNLELSKERVLSVVSYMVENGVNPERVKPFGYGESLPVAANATQEGRERNRRIEIKVVEGLL